MISLFVGINEGIYMEHFKFLEDNYKTLYNDIKLCEKYAYLSGMFKLLEEIIDSDKMKSLDNYIEVTNTIFKIYNELYKSNK